MPLIKSISGIRGTIGGIPGEGLTPVDIVRFTSSFAIWLKQSTSEKKIKVVVGRDARISGKMVNDLVVGTLTGMGIDVIDLGLTTTPTTEIAVTELMAGGGIIITASHNPKEWNALKFLNHFGEFLSDQDGKELLAISDREDYQYAEINQLGSYKADDTFIRKHIERILDLPLVNPVTIKKANLRVAVDAVNSTGGIAVPLLLDALGVKKVDLLYCDPSGEFPHNPEPLPENIHELCRLVIKNKADIGFVVDPDVDRLAIVNEKGEPFGEEYTLVAVSDYILGNKKGNVVSNLSSTQALKIVTESHGCKYYSSAVGEVNVVEMMKKKKAVIGGEGNGGVIYPPLHYGRDALAGIALFLTFLVKSRKKCSALRYLYPDYYISKNRIELSPDMDIGKILAKITRIYRSRPIEIIDGVKIHFDREWVHLRKSNTEPLIRIYAESDMPEKAENLAKKILNDLMQIIINR